MVRYYTKHHGELIEIQEYAIHCWVNITPPFSHEEFEYLSERLNIPSDFFTDPLDIDERSRYEREDSTTICAMENPVLDLFLENKLKNFEPSNIEKFILQIMEQNVYRFIACLKKLNLKRNMLEQELYSSSRNSELWQMLRIEKSLVYFVNSLKANELLKVKMKRIDFLGLGLSEDLEEIFEDLIIDNSQALEMSNVYTIITSSTMETFASIISNNANEDIQRLTFFTILLMVPSIITSFFGMNVELPFAHNSYSYIFIIIFSIVIGYGLVYVLRRYKIF